ncbi:MAG: phosphotransferase [Actinomycetota bacterium]
MVGDLDPALEAAIRAVPAWEGLDPAEVTPITLGITNRNFRVDIGGESFVVRLSGKDTDLLGIDRAAECEAATAAAAVGVAPEVFAFLSDHGALITRFVEGTSIPEETLQGEEVLEKVVASVRAIHEGPPIPSTFDAFRVVEDYREVAESRNVQIPDGYGTAHRLAAEIEAAFGAAPMPPRPCHNDLLNANFIMRNDRVFIVDYEYAGMGHLFFDLGNFSINNGLPEEAQATLLRLYFGEVTPSHAARLKLMRIMSDFREAMWGVVQQGLSTFDFDYVAYAQKHFARCLESAEDERFATWLRDATEGI